MNPQLYELTCDYDPALGASTPGGICCIAFDSQQELVTTGWDDGVVATTYFPPAVAAVGAAAKYSSFRAHAADASVRQVLPVHGFGIVSLSSSRMRIHSHGGVPLIKAERYTKSAEFTAFELLSSTHMLVGTAPVSSANAGGDRDPMHLLSYDLNRVHAMYRPKAVASVPDGVAVMRQGDPTAGGVRDVQGQHHHSFVAVGGTTGSVSLLDLRVRNSKPFASFVAHSGSVLDMDVQGTTLATCGLVRRADEPEMRFYHTHHHHTHSSDIRPPTHAENEAAGNGSPSVGPLSSSTSAGLVTSSSHTTSGKSSQSAVRLKTQCEPFAKVFDLRMMRLLAPVQSSQPPSFVRFLPDRDCALVLVSRSGSIKLCDARGGASVVEQYHHMQTGGGIITGLSAAPTGSALGMSDSAGYVHIWTDRVAHDEHGELTLSLHDPNALAMVAPLEPVPPLTTPVTPLAHVSSWAPENADGIAPMYYCRDIGPNLPASTLLSSMPPAIADRAMKSHPPLSIKPEVLARASNRDYVGYISNDEAILGSALAVWERDQAQGVRRPGPAPSPGLSGGPSERKQRRRG